MKTLMPYNTMKISHYSSLGCMVFSAIILLAFLLVPTSRKIEHSNFRTLTLKFDEAQSSLSLKEGKEFVGIDKVPSIKKKSSKNIDDLTLNPNKLKDFKCFSFAPQIDFCFLSRINRIFDGNFSLSAQTESYHDGESHSLSTTVSRFILYHTIKAFIA